MKKDSKNKHMMSSEKIKYYSEIVQESFESFKILIDVSIRSNVKEWANELFNHKRKHMLMCLNKLKEIYLRIELKSLKKNPNHSLNYQIMTNLIAMKM